MYRKKTEGWLKHYDFILLDMVSLQLAFILSYAFAGNGWNPYGNLLYRNMAVFLVLADAIVIFSLDTLKSVLRRGYYKGFLITVRHGIVVGALAVLYLFLIQEGGSYSRMALMSMIPLYIFLTYIFREIWKKFLHKQMEEGGGRSLLIVTTADMAKDTIANMKKNNYARYTIAGAAIIDCDMRGQVIDGVEVVADGESTPMYVCQEWIDEVLVVVSGKAHCPEDFLDKLTETGVTLHYSLTKLIHQNARKQIVEKVGNYTVLTTSINYASSKQLLAKRVMDICAGVSGCILTGIIFVFIAPAIYISSPGPIFFSQERVGENGKKFKMYKFRSMYMDAEARKAELMKDNKLGDGKMFKLDFDPRVIGNKVLPDGTKKTGIGDFIRKTSLDEFPQFLNVLKGDMSLVGTRPPLIGEVSLYELHHRARLSIKPGITGMWQVSGRSDITDFEEVVELDKSQIPTCNIMGVNIAAINMEWLLEYLNKNIDFLHGDYICVSNVHTTVTAYEEADYCVVQNGGIMAIPDGGPLSTIGRKRGYEKMERTTGPSLMGEIFKITAEKGYRHFFYGSKQETLELLKQKLNENYPGIQIAGMYSPPFRLLKRMQTLLA